MSDFDDFDDLDPDQQSLFGEPPDGHRDGETYDPVLDYDRLNTQQARVYKALRGGEWWTLRDLAEWSGGSEASVSARLRDLRKRKFGGFIIERMRVQGGLYVYRLAGRRV